MCPVFIGRTPERDALSRLIDRTRSGQGQVALVCGEAGIGKSRLVAEAKAYAAAHDFLLLLEGPCFQTDSTFPYAPLLDLFRAYFARWAHWAPISLPETTHSFASTLARLLADLALLCSNCHRMIHRTKRWLTVEELQDLVASQRQPVSVN